MRNILNALKAAWPDPVWSNVYADLIAGAILILLAWFRRGAWATVKLISVLALCALATLWKWLTGTVTVRRGGLVIAVVALLLPYGSSVRLTLLAVIASSCWMLHRITSSPARLGENTGLTDADRAILSEMLKRYPNALTVFDAGVLLVRFQGGVPSRARGERVLEQLALVGIVQQVGNGLFTLTKDGRDYLLGLEDAARNPK
jgi:hypothetical protein